MFHQIHDLEPDLLLQIVRRMAPVAYVRSRRCNKDFDNFCENKRNFIRIYPRTHSEIYLTSSIGLYNWVNGYDMEHDGQQRTIVGLNYGNMRWESNLEIEMTQENISRLRASISGFNFHEIILYSFPEDFQDPSEVFEKALSYFFEAIKGVQPIILTSDLKNTAHYLNNEMAKWKLKFLDLDLYVELNEILISPIIRKLKNISCFLSEFDGIYDFFDVIKDKKGGIIEITREDAKQIVPRFIRKWKDGELDVKNFQLVIEAEDPYYNMNYLFDEGLFIDGFNICEGDYFMTNREQLIIYFWVFILNNGTWAMTAHYREEDDSDSLFFFQLDSISDIYIIIMRAIFRCVPIDLSSAFEIISQFDRPEFIRDFLRDDVAFLKHFYSPEWRNELDSNNEEFENYFDYD